MNKINDWFFFSKGERIGIFILLFFIIFFASVKVYLHYFKNNAESPVDFSEYEHQIDTFYAHIEKQKKITDTKKTISEKHNNTRIQTNTRPKEKLYIDLNSADTTELKKLYGIGKVFAVRILKYRNRLGGYFNKKQLLEIFGLKKETYDKIKHQIWVDTTKIKKIDFNEADFKSLLKHPYLDFEQVKKIVRYRKRHRIFNITQLETDSILDKSLSIKVRPYFKVSGF